MRHRFIKVIFLVIIFFSACHTKITKHKIGISQLGDTDEWRKEMKESIDRELVFYPDVEIIYRQADYNSLKQVEQIRELLSYNIDVLIVSPYEAAPLTPAIEEAYKKGVKVIVVDRNINTDNYNSYVGADNYEIGLIAGKYAANYLNGKGNVLELTGLPTSTPAKERERGFGDAIKNHPQISLKVINGDWLVEGVEKAFPSIQPQLKDFQLVFAHNDVTAKAASDLCRKAGYSHIKFIGVDATPGTGMAWVEDGSLLASVLYPNGGAEAIRTANQLLKNENVQRNVSLKTIMVDSSNVKMLQQQISKINDQQKNIIRQQQLIAKQTKNFNTQKNLVLFLIISLFLIFSFLILLLRLRIKIVKANKTLQLQNEEIKTQSGQIIELAEMAKQANEEKLNFFTDISHEIKTPLTLILAPTEEALANPKLPETIKTQFSIVRRNAGKLLLLVNQLMDFRKIDLNKMNLRVIETDIVLLLNEVIYSFSSFSKQNDIDCRLITKEAHIMVWVDAEKIERVFFNIISNAIKFTNPFGYVYVTIESNIADQEVVVHVQDSGRGLTEVDKTHLFDRYYSGDHADYTDGSGLGLSLSKKIIELHQGTITASSEKNKGSTFSIKLKMGYEHFNAEFLLNNKDYQSQSAEWIKKLDNADRLKSMDFNIEEEGSNKEHTILIVEDNTDLRDFLSIRLAKNYNTLTAADGIEGLKFAFDYLPDIIILDITLPGKNGLELTRYLKNDIRTEHVPIILLMANTSEESRLDGIKSKADAYITKPFHVEVIEETVQNLLENRTKLKDYFTAEVPKEISGGALRKADRVFYSSLSSIIKKNISNENFSVEDICRELGISKIQLYRKAKTALSISINEFILTVRIQRAKHYLQNEDLSIAEIAYKTGFSTPSYFSTAFKKITGETPRAFKEKFH